MAKKRAYEQIVKYLRENPGWNRKGTISKQLDLDPHALGKYCYVLDEVERYVDGHKEVWYRLKE